MDLPFLFHACLCIALHAALATWSTLSAIAVFRRAKCMCEKESLTSSLLSLSLCRHLCNFSLLKKKKLTQGCKVQAILITSVYSGSKERKEELEHTPRKQEDIEMQYRFLAAYLPCSRSLLLVSPPVRKAVVYCSDASVNSSTRLSACSQIAHTAVHQEVLQIRGGDLRSRARHRQFCVQSSSTSEQVSMEGDGIEPESTGSGVDLKQSQQPLSSRYGIPTRRSAFMC